MKKLFFYFSLVACLFLLVGVGCSQQKNDIEETSDEQGKTIDPQQKQETANSLQLAYLNCIESGNETSLHFDPNSGLTKLFCIVDGSVECEAEKFAAKICPEKEVVEIKNGEKQKGCPLDVDPVCGEDGYTYANRCIAELQNIKIISSTACKADLQRVQTPSYSEGSNSSRVSGQNQPVIQEAEQQDWVSILIDLAKTESSQKPITIEQCRYSPHTLYFKSGDFPILYNNSGQVLCYPDHDFANNCPAYFEKTSRTRYCSALWGNI